MTKIHSKTLPVNTQYILVQFTLDFTVNAQMVDVDKVMLHVGTVPVKNWEAHSEDSVEARSIGLAAYICNQLFEIHSNGKIMLKASVFGKLIGGAPTPVAILDSTTASANAEPQIGVGGQNTVPGYNQYG